MITLSEQDLERLPVAATVCRATDPTVVYTRIDPAGPNGPWRRYEAGTGPVTCRSSTLALIGVVEC